MRTRPGQRGSILILFTLFSFGFFGLAALLVDLGYARLTQLQMQAAADSGVLTGLRERDNPNVPAASRDLARRERVSQQTQKMFDDDFDLSADEKNLGAGPALEVQPGAGGYLSRIPEEALEGPLVYQPELQTNPDNDPGGDMLSGEYDFAGESFAAGSPPDPAANAFFVQMRRSEDPEEAGVSSTGPPLPLLFGAGSLVRKDSSVSRLTVRAASFSAARRALAAGVTQGRAGEPGTRVPGVTPVALDRTYWDGIPLGSQALCADPSGNVYADTGSGYCATGAVDPSEAPVGWFVFGQGEPVEPVSIGREAQPAPPEAALIEPEIYDGLVAYLPLAQEISGVRRVVGFGAAEVAFPAGGVVFPLQFSVVKHSSRVAARNASALLRDGGGLSAMDPADQQALLDANGQFNEPLEAPALVRAE